jgi:hypothetical protein
MKIKAIKMTTKIKMEIYLINKDKINKVNYPINFYKYLKLFF